MAKKYIDADKLKAEIERLKGQLIRGSCAAQIEMETNCKDEAYNEVLAFLDTLSEEPDNDLDEAATEYSKEVLFRDWDNPDDNIVDFDDIKYEAFKAGAKWQAEKCDEETSKLLYAERQTAYINGWDDHKEQMLKDAVEGYVNYYEDSGGILMAEAQVGCPYHNGDKVKLIIIKDDGKSD